MNIQRGGLGYPSGASYEHHISSTGDVGYSEAAVEILKALRKWEKRVTTEQHNIAEAVCFDNKSIRACGRHYRKTRRSISKILKEALNEWYYVLNPAVSVKKSSQPKTFIKEPFNTTKTYIFIDDEK